VLEVWKRLVEDPGEVRPNVGFSVEFQCMDSIAPKPGCISHAIQARLDPFFPFFDEHMCVDLYRTPVSHFETLEHRLGGETIYPSPQQGSGHDRFAEVVADEEDGRPGVGELRVVHGEG